MAKKSAAKKPKKAKSKEKAQKQIIELVSEATLTSLLKSCLAMQNVISHKSGEMGDMIRNASESKGLHRGAFNAIKGLYRMGKKDGSKLWLYLAHFDDMRKKCGLDDLAAEQGELIEATEQPKEKKKTKAKAAEAPTAPAEPQQTEMTIN